jgi:hypothetical protein
MGGFLADGDAARWRGKKDRVAAALERNRAYLLVLVVQEAMSRQGGYSHGGQARQARRHGLGHDGHSTTTMRSEPRVACCCCACGNELPPHSTSVVWFSESSVTLAKCLHCGKAVDEYVELDLPLVCMDLALHRVPAFRHVIRNLDDVRGAGRTSVWARLYFIILFILLLQRHVVSTLLAQLVRAVVILAGVSSSLNESWPIARRVQTVFRCFTLGQAPSFLLVVAWAWNYPATFQSVIDLYSATCTVAALQALPKVSLVRATSIVLLAMLTSNLVVVILFV